MKAPKGRAGDKPALAPIIKDRKPVMGKVYWFLMDSDWRHNSDLSDWYVAQDTIDVQEKLVRIAPKPIKIEPKPQAVTPSGIIYDEDGLELDRVAWRTFPTAECLTMTDSRLASLFKSRFKRLVVHEWVETIAM